MLETYIRSLEQYKAGIGNQRDTIKEILLNPREKLYVKDQNVASVTEVEKKLNETTLGLKVQLFDGKYNLDQKLNSLVCLYTICGAFLNNAQSAYRQQDIEEVTNKIFAEIRKTVLSRT